MSYLRTMYGVYSNSLLPHSHFTSLQQMNRRSLSPDHGYPLRVVIPGCTGARWVKWVDRITIARSESPNYYQRRDYKVLPPECETEDMAEPLWDKCPAILTLPVHSIIASVRPAPNQENEGVLKVKGYAMGGDVRIAGVQVALQTEEGCKEAWVEATITYQEGKWSWTLWEYVLDIRHAQAEIERKGGNRELTVLSRARDKNGEEQKRECVWNMRGVAFSAYGKWDWRW